VIRSQIRTSPQVSAEASQCRRHLKTGSGSGPLSVIELALLVMRRAGCACGVGRSWRGRTFVFDRFDAVDVAFDAARAVGKGESVADCLVVAPQSGDEAVQVGRSAASTAAIQESRRSPWRPVKISAKAATWVAVASRCGQAVSTCLSRSCWSVSRSSGWRSIQEVIWRTLGYRRLRRWCGAELAEGREVDSDGALAASVALLGDFPVERAGVGDAGVAAFVQVGFVGIQEAGSARAGFGQQVLDVVGAGERRTVSLARSSSRLMVLMPLPSALRAWTAW
jgi:hypothetical protein